MEKEPKDETGEIEIPEWNQLSPENQNYLLKKLTLIKMLKFALLGATSLFIAIQPMVSKMYEGRSAQIALEKIQIERASQATEQLYKVVLENLMTTNQKLMDLQLKNQILESSQKDLIKQKDELQKQIDTLKNANN